LLVPFPGGPTKPTDVLRRVLVASKGTERLGTEDVRGVETTHYRAEVDSKKLIEQLPPGRRPEPNEMAGDRLLPVDLWIDGESRLRRIRLTEELSEDDEAQMVMTIELFDYGVEVDVQPPPADQIISQEELEKLQDKAWDDEFPMTTTGEGEPQNPEQVCKWAREELPEEDADEFCEKVEKQ
jgi:hypothetical protein